jgi:beta-aspartyl-peptidase (threonine type)
MKENIIMDAANSENTSREFMSTLPGDDVRQIMWRFADRYDIQMAVQSARTLARGVVARLVAEGARLFAREHGVPTCETEELVVPAQRRRWEERHGTVGGVAVDVAGRSAAATSTGGLFDALPGRVGDSALIGCGTYAAEEGAVSCTGVGEAIMRVGLARTAVELLRASLGAGEAASRALSELSSRTQSEAGLIVADRDGGLGFAKNTAHMPVCLIRGGMDPALSL